MKTLPRRWPLFLLPLLAALPACSGDEPTTPKPNAPTPVGAEIRCTVNVPAATLACTPATAGASGTRANLVVGGQLVNVDLTSSGNRYDAAAQEFASDVSVKNLMAIPIGTPDGTTAYGAYVFITSGPTVTAGTGSVTIANADGTRAFTAGNQRFFHYPGIIPTVGTSPAKTWRFRVPSTVQSFTFTAYVETQLPSEQGVLRWVREQGGALRGQGTPLAGVWASSERNAWAVSAYGGAPAHDILHFDGVQWRAVPAAGELFDVHGTDARNVYAVGSGSLVMKYDGSAWTTLGTGTSSVFLHGVWASSATEAWAVGYTDVLVLPRTVYQVGVVLHTTNGGQSWTSVQLPGPASPATVPYSRLLNDVAAWGSTVVAVGYEFTAGGIVGLVLRSTNGGATWTEQRFPGAGGANHVLNGAWAADATHFFAVGDGVVMRSSDAGATWSTATPAGAFDLRAVSGSDAQHLLVVGAKSAGGDLAMRSDDGGATWTDVTPQLGGRLYGVSMLPTGKAFAVGENGAARYDGAAWTKDRVAGDAGQLRAVWGSGPSRVYTVGTRYSGGTPVDFVQRYDGTTWTDATLHLSAVPRTLTDVSGAGRDSAWVVGSRTVALGAVEAVIERTINGGVDWTEAVFAGTAPPCCTQQPGRGLEAVSAGDARHVFAVGSDAVSGAMVMRSSDGGVTWTTAFFPAPQRFFTDVWAVDSATVVVIGKQAGAAGGVEGVMLRSTDGGATWTTTTWPTPRSSAEDQPLLRITGAGKWLFAVGWYLGTSGYFESRILSSSNAGASWTTVTYATAGQSSQLLAIAATDSV
ncbi:MAG TPA: hypothetical protein VF771_13850, partial [Longimicrobiaceae bacterium]